MHIKEIFNLCDCSAQNPFNLYLRFTDFVLEEEFSNYFSYFFNYFYATT